MESGVVIVTRQMIEECLSKLVNRSYIELKDIETKKHQVKEKLDKKEVVTLGEMASEYEKVATITEELKDIKVTEIYSGRRACGIPRDPATRKYHTNLEIRLRMDEKLTIEVENPREIINAGRL